MQFRICAAFNCNFYFTSNPTPKSSFQVAPVLKNENFDSTSYHPPSSPSSSDSNAQNIINQALYLGSPSAFNSTKDDCKWKFGNERDICPDPDINVILYTSSNGKNRGKLLVSLRNATLAEAVSEKKSCTANLKCSGLQSNLCDSLEQVP